jgi:lipopolysaccharide export system permease protein
MPAVRRLDRYVFGEFWKLMLATILGFPVLLIIGDLTQHIEDYLSRNISMGDLALSYVYWLPESMFMAFPAAVLFATVFSIAALTRHSELTAAKASGMSFYRLTAPIFVGAALAFGLDVMLGDVAPAASRHRSQLIKQDAALIGTSRSNFVFAGEYGRVYQAQTLSTDIGVVRGLHIERKGASVDYPTYVLNADSAVYQPRARGWLLGRGELSLVGDSSSASMVSFASARDRRFVEAPIDLMAKPREPSDLTYADLTRVIASVERSGSNANLLRVERALKLAVPATCVIIVLFGAPLATSTKRGGSAFGIAVSLATTMIFLVMIQLARAIGGKGVIPPDLAAWIPALVFGSVGLVLLARVRT